jgi:hypothetical protein
MNRMRVARGVTTALLACSAFTVAAVLLRQHNSPNRTSTNAVPVVMVGSSGAPLKNLFAGITPTPRYFELVKNNASILARTKQVSCGAAGGPGWINTTLLSLKQFFGLSSTVHA